VERVPDVQVQPDPAGASPTIPRPKG
jgi:hypothetical protein